MAATEHRYGEGYSANNPVPTIQKYQDDKKAQQSALPPPSTTSDAPPVPPKDGVSSSQAPGNSEKQELMDRMKSPQQNPIDRIKKLPGGEREVRDPVTGETVRIKDAEFKDYPAVESLDPLGTSGPALTAPTDSSKAGNKSTQNDAFTSPAGDKFSPSKPAPNPAHPSNVSLQPFPPAPPASLKGVLRMFDYLQLVLLLIPLILFLTLARHHGWLNFLLVSLLCSLLAGLSTTLASLAQRKLEKELERVRFDMHAQRGHAYAPPTPESVEWLNAFIGTFWGLVNPDMFTSVADTIEDVMQQSLPGFVDAVRISDIGQGSNPLRILSMRALPDQPGDKEYPREEWIDQGTGDIMKKAKEEEKKGKDADQAGEYVNFEVSFAYQALPGQGDKLRSKNIHLLIEFFLGAFDWLHIPIPIWIQVEGLAGTVRLRIQFIPEMPYVRNLTFTLMGVPAVEVSAIPLIKALPNILDLPLISRFVKMAIAAGTAELVAPKSMTLNIQEMMSGAAVGDTRAIGVFLITIHHAEGLSAQDSNGKSDPYVVLAFAKFGKPLYSTRVILEDLNPVFEETAALLVSGEEVKAEEDLSAMLWDSDKRTSDDLIGRIHLPVKELIAKPNQWIRRVDKLEGFEDADTMSGTLTWSIGYFDKVPLNKGLELPPENPPPQTPKTEPEMEMRPGDKAPAPAARDGPPPAPDVQRTPPDPRFPSGILNVVVHQINNLERQNLGGSSGNREGQAGQDTDEPSEQSDNLPSAYCEIVVNDDMVYKTRVKQYSTMPFFEAGTEVFVRDWQKCVVRVVVRDSRLREKDPILGIVTLPLQHLLSEGSEVTRMYAIQEGIGFGRANITVLFKAIDAKLPRNQLGWDTGTIELYGPITIDIDPSKHERFMTKTKKLMVSTSDSTEIIPKSDGTVEADRVTWEIEKVRLPVYNRYASSLTFQVGAGGGVGPFGGKPEALAVLWLQELVDDEEKQIKIPVVVGPNLAMLRQNVLNAQAMKTHEFEVVGYLMTTVKLDSGLDEDFEEHAEESEARRHAFEAYDHAEGEAVIAERNAHAADDGVIDKKEQKQIDQAQKRQLANRQRGIASYKPYRTMKWMKEGIKKRIMPGKSASKSEPAVQSEA